MSQHQPIKASWPLTLGAIGIVFGDIGTSPLYTMKTCLSFAPGEREAAIFGSASLIVWTLFLIVNIKYILFITRADNQGEGGIFALLALRPKQSDYVKTLSLTVLLILAGAAFLYGDGVITPAISVLSAAEGLKGVSAFFQPWIVPIACGILFSLFWFQHRGTAHIGTLFGPIMVVWFAVLGVTGLVQICRMPVILEALNPMMGLRLLVHYPAAIAGLLGAVVLAVTGAEALYADMGHFGRASIARGWMWIVFPGLLLNYLGQGAYLLRHLGSEPDNPFFALVPHGHLRAWFVALSLVATVIASQALISGTFSLARQGVHLGYFPRLGVIHTSADVEGQIFIPSLNWFLGAACICVVIGFGSSDALASAYGIAVTGTMAATTIAFYHVVYVRWKWPQWAALLLCGLFLTVDLIFFGSNLQKFFEGGWLPLLLGAGLFAIMVTWRRGRAEVLGHLLKQNVDISVVANDVQQNHVLRVPGTAVFMSAHPKGTPIALLHHLKANRCLHQTVVLLTVHIEGVPHVPSREHVKTEDLGGGMWRALASYGYLDVPHVPELLRDLHEHGIAFNPMTTTYYFNRETVLVGKRSTMWHWQKELYRVLSQNARPARDYFNIPSNQIIEMGLPVEL